MATTRSIAFVAVGEVGVACPSGSAAVPHAIAQAVKTMVRGCHRPDSMHDSVRESSRKGGEACRRAASCGKHVRPVAQARQPSAGGGAEQEQRSKSERSLKFPQFGIRRCRHNVGNTHSAWMSFLLASVCPDLFTVASGLQVAALKPFEQASQR